MSRAAGEPYFSRRSRSPQAGPLPEAIGEELCDYCGALARVRVPVAYTTVRGYRRLGELLFCKHHFEEHRPALVTQGLRVA